MTMRIKNLAISLGLVGILAGGCNNSNDICNPGNKDYPNKVLTNQNYECNKAFNSDTLKCIRNYPITNENSKIIRLRGECISTAQNIQLSCYNKARNEYLKSTCPKLE